MKHANIALFVPHMGCPQQCSFCNQRTISGTVKPPVGEDVAAACKRAMQGGCEGASVQLAFFGGSFTAIERGYMTELLSAAQPYIENGFLNDGIRISTRPDAIDGEILSLLSHYGVRAIELGAQSMNDLVLSKNLRGHTARDVVNASRLIKQSGFELGLQMMTGLYGSDRAESLETARQFIGLQPDTVRIYPTVVLRGTRLAQLMESGEFVPQTLDETVDICSELLQVFESNSVRVIRLGLHAQDGVEADAVGGAYHPALRELCEGEIYYKRTVAMLSGKPRGRYDILVSSSAVSKAVGQKKKNLLRLEQAGYICKVKACKALSGNEIEIIQA